MASKITLEFKKTTCPLCKQTDKGAIKEGQPYCKAKNPKMKRGQCTGFTSSKPKSTKKE